MMANPLARLATLFAEIREEMKQVAWPTREELLGSGMVVLIGVAILAIYISVCDLALSTLIQRLLHFGQ